MTENMIVPSHGAVMVAAEACAFVAPQICFFKKGSESINSLLRDTYESITPRLARLSVGDDHCLFNVPENLEIFPET